MQITRLQVRGFRNLEPMVLDVDSPLVAFIGANGQGKTNLLEAVGVLGTLKSFRTTRPGEMIRWGETTAMVQARGISDGMTRIWQWCQQDGERSLVRDGRTVDAAGWLRTLRASYFVPGDTSFLRGEPALRRALLDRAVLTIDPGYLAIAQAFRRVLAQKAALLRGPSSSLQLDILDEQFAELGAAVIAARVNTVMRITAVYQHFYEEFSGTEPAAISYRGVANSEDRTVIAATLRELLERSRSAEQQAGRPLVGPQRDDLGFTLANRSARNFASQGQARSMILAWKLAELEVARAEGEVPLFLLDDLGSELDPGRTRRLVGLLRTLGAQIFLTTTDARFLPADTDARCFQVVEGHIENSGASEVPIPLDIG